MALQTGRTTLAADLQPQQAGGAPALARGQAPLQLDAAIHQPLGPAVQLERALGAEQFAAGGHHHTMGAAGAKV